MESLINKTYSDSSILSRYTPFPYYYHTKDDNYIRGLTAYLKDTTAYTLYTVRRGDTFDSIALDFYNNPTLFWVICSYNHIQDPFTELVVGQQIKVPSLSSIEFDI